MSYSVTYWVLNKGAKPAKTTNVCFAGLNYAPPCDTVRYMARVDDDLADADIKLYLDFLREWLDGKRWKEKFMGPLASFAPCKRRIFYVLNSKGMKPVKRLLYLTALRYVDEYPEVITQFAKRTKKTDDLEVRFKEFQRIHADAEGRKFPVKNGNFSGHGLMSSYYRDADIGVKDFQARIDTANSVNNMWKKA